MARLQEKHQQWGGEGRGAGGRHLRCKDPGCSECGRVLLGPVRSGPTVAGLVLPGSARGTGALAWPPAAPQPASLQRSQHLSRGSLASRSCSWSPRAPQASIHGPACRRGSRSSDDTTQFPIDGGCFLLGPLWLWGGCASTALTWTRRGVGPLPLGHDRETVQGGNQKPDPQRLDSAPRVSPAPASLSLGSCGRPSDSESRESLLLWGTVRRGRREDSFPTRLLSRLPHSEPIRGSRDTKSWETLKVQTTCLRGWMQSNR